MGFLATGNLLLPVVSVITLGHWHILGPERFPLGTESLGIPSGPEIAVGNWHLLISSLLWILCSLSLLRIIRSSIFMIFSVLAFFALLTTGFIIAGMEEWRVDIIAGRYLFAAIGLFVFGTFLDRCKYTKYGDCSKATGKLLGPNLQGFVPKQMIAAKNERQGGYIRKTLSNEKYSYT